MKRIINGFFLSAPILLLLPLLCSSAERPIIPALVVNDDDKSQPLAITEVEVKIRILGCLAEAQMTMVFQNDYDREFEGDLYFPLPEGATVSGYALDVNGVMVDGVAVEKIRGRQVLETLERRGIDPGLVEWTQGNNFKTRVFPIPAKNTRTVRVSYVSELVFDTEGAHFVLPLNFTNKLKEIRFQVEANQCPGMPVLKGQWPANMRFEPWQGGYRALAKSSGTTVAGQLEIVVPQREGAQVLVEKASDGQYYFCINDHPKDPRAGKPAAKPRPPRRVTLFWDASASRKDADHAQEVAFLRAYFGQFAASVIDLRLVVIRNTASLPQFFIVTGGNISALEEKLAGIAYDGGTRLDCLDAKVGGGSSDQYLLFSDGLNNLGSLEPLDFRQPLFVVSSSLTLDGAVLRNLAAKSGGGFVNLRQSSVSDALALMNGHVLVYLGIHADAGTADVCPRLVQPIFQRLFAVGRLNDDTAKVQISYGVGGQRLATSTIKLNRANATSGDTLRRYWAQKKLDDLLVLADPNRDEILALGKQHALVTPETSLMVLDSLEQYLAFRIQPPESLLQLRAEYAKEMKQLLDDEKAEKQEAQEHEKQLKEDLIEQWQERVEWWQTDFRSKKVAAASGPVTPRTQTLLGQPIPNPIGAPSGQPPSQPTTTNLVAALPPTDQYVRSTPPTDPVWMEFSQVAAAAPAFAPAAMAMEVGAPEGMDAATIDLKEYDPKAPYLDALKEASPAGRFATYLQFRPKYCASPGFFLDCADFFNRNNDRPTALQVLSNLAEMEAENISLLRVMARRLEQIDELDLAVGTFERILCLRPDEPQSSRDLALVLAKRGKRDKNQRDYVRALDLMASIINEPWERYENIKLLVLVEFNALWAEYSRKYPAHQRPFPIDKRLKKLLDLDVRIVLTWDADMTDIDLHVVEPGGDRAYYARQHTGIGGLIGEDITAGNGPEEYCLRRAALGSYKIEVDYFGSASASVLGPVTVQAEVITNFGRTNEKRKNLTLRLSEEKEHIEVGEIKF